MIKPMPFRCRCGHEIIANPAAPIVDCAACGGRTWLRTGCYQPVGPRPEFVPPRGGSGGINRPAGPTVDIAQKLVDAVPMLGEAISEIERLRIRVEAAEARVAVLEAAIRKIADHPACSYEHWSPPDTSSDRNYQIGITDGHRAAAMIARAALAPEEE